MSKNVNIIKRKGIPVKTLSYTAMLTAVCALCNIFTVLLGVGGSFAISFTYIPCFISGAFFGPLAGFITGLFGDLLGVWIAPKGDLNPIILLSSSLLGLIPGIVFWIYKKIPIKNINIVVPTVISLVLVFAICTNLNTIGLYLFYFRGAGKTLEAVYILRMPKQLIIWSINLIICIIIVKPVAKMLKM